ncbi:MAG TPA: PAS domain-containing protein [Polyangiaceae bacterium]|nr:PAS domain-containing protein [Polyangiaceae bacterium]
MVRDADDQVLHSVMREIHEGILLWSVPQGAIMTCNEAAARILGTPRGEIEGRTLEYPWQLAREDGSSLPPEERGAFRAVRTGQSQQTQVLRVRRPDDTWAWVRSTSVVLREKSSAPSAVVTTFVDITELRQAREQMKLMASRLGEAMEGANVGTWELDLVTGHAERNARWGEIFGLVPSEIEPTLAAFSDRIHPEERAACLEAMAAGFRDGVPFIIECRARHADGRWLWVEKRGKVAEYAADGRPRRVAGVLVDVDARKRTEESLRIALAENERLVSDLQQALENVRTLEGLLPICMYCKAIREDSGTWAKLETYVTRHAKVAFSHGICPACCAQKFPEDAEP